MHLFVLCLLVLVSPRQLQHAQPSAPAKASRIQKRNLHEETNSTESKPAQQGNKVPSLPTPYEQAAQTASKQSDAYDPRNDSLYRTYLWATVVGVAGGLIVMGLLAWQAYLFRENTKVLMNAERPWIVVPRNEIELSNEFIRHSDDLPDTGMREHLKTEITIRNVGKTAARIVTVVGGAEIVKELGHKHALNEESYSSQAEGIISPGEFTKINFLTPDVSGKDKEDVFVRFASFLLVFGIVEYLDTFERKHSCRFCYVLDGPREKFRYLCHNPRHNEYS